MKHSRKKNLNVTIDEYLINDLKMIADYKKWTLSYLVNECLTSVYKEVLSEYIESIGGVAHDDIKGLFM